MLGLILRSVWHFLAMVVFFTAIALVLVAYTGKNPFVFRELLDYRLVTVGVPLFFALYAFRTYKNGGILEYWEGMTVAATVYIASALILGFFVWILLAWIDPSLLTDYIDRVQQLIISDKARLTEQMGEANYQDQLKSIPLTTPFDLAWDYFLKTLLIGLFLSVLFSLILRRKPN
jgi:hypothetical protein